MVSDAFIRHNRTHPDASKMQHFQQSKRVDIWKSIQTGSSLQTHPDALTTRGKKRNSRSAYSSDTPLVLLLYSCTPCTPLVLHFILWSTGVALFPPWLTICDAFRYVQSVTFSSVTTLFDTKTPSDTSCYCMRWNAFETLQKLFKNITLYFTINSFLSLHDIPIST